MSSSKFQKFKGKSRNTEKQFFYSKTDYRVPNNQKIPYNIYKALFRIWCAKMQLEKYTLRDFSLEYMNGHQQ